MKGYTPTLTPSVAVLEQDYIVAIRAEDAALDALHRHWIGDTDGN